MRAWEVVLSYIDSTGIPMERSCPRGYGMGVNTNRGIALNATIYIVGLVVVIGAVLGFLGLR